jgi:chemotaxis protein MotB
MVEGHTDNVPIKTACIKDNWDLSVLRATSIVRILTVDNKVNPKQVLPAGKGEFVPVASNDTKEDRAKNRRTEIVLSPNLDKIFKILEGK